MLYKHINEDQRKLIDFFFNVEKLSISEIALKLEKSKSTISREIRRNSYVWGYNSETATNKYIWRRRHKHFGSLNKYKDFTQLFLKYYDKRFHGVEATCHKIKTNHPNVKCPSARQVFRWINWRGWKIRKKDRLRPYICHPRKRKIGIFSIFKNKRVLPIWTRPKSIDLRCEYGHWEVDLIVGKQESGYWNLLTFVERMTREIHIIKLRSKNPMKLNGELYKLIKQRKLVVKSITCDNGLEFAKIGLLANWLDCMIYFCEPYASYQRGSNENANGLVRRLYKKGTDFTNLTINDIMSLEKYINEMPRKMFDWKSSSEIKALL